MQKAGLIIAGTLGILLGVWYILTQTTPSLRRCKTARGLSHHILLTAVLVSALAACFLGCSKRTPSANNTNPASATSQQNAQGLDALQRLQNWQELKVIWNLLTSDQRILEGDKSRELLPYSLNESLCHLVITLRLDEIQKLRVLSDVELAALRNLFETMSAHYFEKHSHATCYISSPRGAEIIDGRNTIEQQTALLRKHYRQGTLTRDVVTKAEEAILAKLTLLEILNEEDVGLVTADEIKNRIAKWKIEGNVASLDMQFETRRAAINELLAEKNASLPESEKKQRTELWERHKQRLAQMIGDLCTYKPDDRLERQTLMDLEGKTLDPSSIGDFLKNPANQHREALIEIYANRAGRKSIPTLTTLLNDDEIKVSGWEQNSNTVCRITFPVRNAAARELARMGIKTPGFKIATDWQPDDQNSYQSNTPEGIEVIKKLLKSKNPTVLRHAIWPAGETKDLSMIPFLQAIAREHPDLHEEIARALGNIRHEDGLPLLLDLAKAGYVDPSTVFYSVSKIGGPRAAEFLEEQMLTSPSTSAQSSAVYMLGSLLDKQAIPALHRALKETGKPFLQIYAGMYLQDLGDNAAVPLAMELVTSEDEAIRDNSFHILESADDSASAERLLQLAEDKKYTRKAVESLMGRGGSLAADTFTRIMKSDSQELKEVVVFQCVNSDFPGAEELLLVALKDPSDAIRSQAIYSLGRRGTAKSLPVLRALLSATPAAADSIKKALRDIVENQCERRCAEIMKQNPTGNISDLTDDDFFALLVVRHRRWQYAPESAARREFAAGRLDKVGPRLATPIIRYFSEYAHDTHEWDFMTTECQAMLKTLDTFPEKALPQIMTFIADTNRWNRQLGLAFLDGRGYERKAYPPEATTNLKELVAACLKDPDAEVRAEAERLQAIMAAAPEDREFATALYDIRVPRDRGAALSTLRYKKLNDEQKQRLIPVLLETLNDMVDKKNMDYLWDAIGVVACVKDKRLAPPLIKLISSYDPDNANERESERVREAVEVLKSMNIRVTLGTDGRYQVN